MYEVSSNIFIFLSDSRLRREHLINPNLVEAIYLIQTRGALADQITGMEVILGRDIGLLMWLYVVNICELI